MLTNYQNNLSKFVFTCISLFVRRSVHWVFSIYVHKQCDHKSLLRSNETRHPLVFSDSNQWLHLGYFVQPLIIKYRQRVSSILCIDIFWYVNFFVKNVFHVCRNRVR